MLPVHRGLGLKVIPGAGPVHLIPADEATRLQVLPPVPRKGLVVDLEVTSYLDEGPVAVSLELLDDGQVDAIERR